MIAFTHRHICRWVFIFIKKPATDEGSASSMTGFLFILIALCLDPWCQFRCRHRYYPGQAVLWPPVPVLLSPEHL